MGIELHAEYLVDRDGGAELPPWRDADNGERRAGLAAYAAWLMDRDRKSPGLKRLQGWIWEEGYRAGELRSELAGRPTAAQTELSAWLAA